MNIEYLRDGALRIRGADCTFVFTRIRPGVLLTSISGLDSGELGTAPLDEVEAEFERFRTPLEWFVDASAAMNARSGVFQQWTGWLDSNRAKLQRIQVLTGTKPAHLTISIARHLSNTDTLMTVYTEQEEFTKVLRAAGWEIDLSDRSREPGVLVRGDVMNGSRHIRTPSAEVTVRVTDRSIVSTFTGREIDVLATPSMDAVGASIKERQNVQWFADLRGADVSKQLMEAWTTWIIAHRSSFSRIAILANAGAFPLILDIVNYRHGLDGLIRTYREEEEYQRAMRAS
jgi:hypothetical protein